MRVGGNHSWIILIQFLILSLLWTPFTCRAPFRLGDMVRVFSGVAKGLADAARAGLVLGLSKWILTGLVMEISLSRKGNSMSCIKRKYTYKREKNAFWPGLMHVIGEGCVCGVILGCQRG